MQHSDPQIETLVQALTALSTAPTSSDVMRIAKHAARRLADADGATFVVRDGDCCYYADEEAIAPLWKGQRYLMDVCVSGEVMRSRRSIAIEDVRTDPSVPVEAYEPTFVRGLLMTPIGHDEPIGAIGVYWSEPHLASDELGEMLRALAGGVAAAYENLRLRLELSRRSDELEAAREKTSAVFRAVSKTLREPLDTILDWARLVADGALDGEAARAASKVVVDVTTKHMQTVDDYLQTSHALAGAIRLDVGPVELPEIVAGVIAGAAAVAEAKGLTLALHLDPAAVGRLAGDASRLEQCVRHLLTNAIRFTPKGGRIDVRVGRAGPMAQVTVEDTGVGFDPARSESLFRRLPADGGAGLGIGLALVRDIVQAHHGTVVAASAGSLRGSVFTIRLPIASLSSETRRSRPDLVGHTVLVLDQDAESRALVSAILRPTGAAVAYCSTVSQALELAAERAVSVAVCDLPTIGVDDRALLPALRTPLVAVVEDRSDPFGSSPVFAGAVAKPLEERGLLTEILRALRRSDAPGAS